jgi:hypothetical protein
VIFVRAKPQFAERTGSVAFDDDHLCVPGRIDQC